MTPICNAVCLGTTYLVVAVTYILLSGSFAADAAGGDPALLAQLERTKGLVFVTLTAALLGGLALVLSRRMRRTEETRRQTAEALVAAEARASAGVFAASVAHDLNNMLTVAFTGLADLRDLRDRLDDPEVLDDVERALTESAQLSRRLAGAGRSAGTVVGEWACVDLVDAAHDALALARLSRRARCCRLRVVADGPVAARVRPALVRQTLVNLLLNAGEATGGRGTIEVRVRREANAAVLEVHDDGPGVPPDRRQRVFEPHFTTRPDGTGLGLVSVRGAAELHRGTAEVLDSDLGGACFRVRLPEAAERPAPRRETQHAQVA